VAAAWRRRLEPTNWHYSCAPSKISIVSPARSCHDGLLPALAGALDGAAALRLGLNLDHVDARDLDVEELLDGLADLRLVRVRVDAECVAPRTDAAYDFSLTIGLRMNLTGVHI